jgi:multiple sugar transport system substrate-binding protein/raffinose/stachyose/melibiose transport system substrate-binding protein
MMDRGYFTDPSTDFFGDMPRLFNDNKLAMICAGTWYYQANLLNNGIPAEKVGFFFIPAKDGSNRAILEPSPILIPKNAPHKDAALKAADYFMSAKGNTFLAKHSGGFPVNSKSDASYLTAFQKSIQDKVNGGNFNLPVRFWENMPTELMLQVNGKFQEFIVRQTAPATICADIQKLCDAYFNK